MQEALTNAVKHSPGAFTTVRLAYEPGRPRPGPKRGRSSAARAPARSSDAGHGIIGMKERVLLPHGTITVGPTKDGWEVSVHLPLEAGAGQADASVALPTPAW